MGVGGKFWDLLKPYARNEGFDFLRNKRVAIDLSFWIVQHETALKNKARNPHIRLTFFRTINLFSKLGVLPVFVVDGVPSPLKARARIERYFRFSGIDLWGLANVEEGVSVERNGAFQKCVRECVELLELLGMPVLRASGEAEALCAQLNHEGHVDACITADSDAFLFGAKCVIKCLRPNSKEPFECYYMSDIEAGLGLKRKHLIAISLLVGNDHDLSGVSGIGTETALRLVQLFPEDEILKRLQEVGNGDMTLFKVDGKFIGDCSVRSSTENLGKRKVPHCTYCGHPGNKRGHFKYACEYCKVNGNESCIQKPLGFKCRCSTCDLDRKNKVHKKQECWQTSVCSKIIKEKNFPNVEIIDMYLRGNHGDFSDTASPSLLWEKPNMETLVDFLGYHQHWNPSYIRQRVLPMLSTIFLREKVLSPTGVSLLHEQYEFHSIQRVKIRCGQPCYLVKWKKVAPAVGCTSYTIQTEQCDVQQEEVSVASDSVEVLDERDVPQILADDGGFFWLTEENMELVKAAFPDHVGRFLQEQEIKQLKSQRRKSGIKSSSGLDISESPKSSGVQLSITEFYCSTKVLVQAKRGDEPVDNIEGQPKGPSNEKRKMTSPNLSKSVRRRLLFD